MVQASGKLGTGFPTAEASARIKQHGLCHRVTERRPDAVLLGMCSVPRHLSAPAAAAPAALAALCWSCCRRLCLGGVGGRLVSYCCCVCVCVWGVQHKAFWSLNGVAGAYDEGKRDHCGIWQHTQCEDACSKKGGCVAMVLAVPPHTTFMKVTGPMAPTACVFPTCGRMTCSLGSPTQSHHPDPPDASRIPGLACLAHMLMWLTCVIITAEKVSVLQPVLLPLDCKHRAAVHTQGRGAWLCTHN